MWNSPEWIISFFGILKAGATVTALNPSFREREAKHQLGDSESVAVIVEEDGYPIIRNVRGELPGLKEVIVVGWRKYPGTRLFQELIDRYPPKPPKVEIDPMKDLAVIQYTAGTTGLPKGCMLTHHNLVSELTQVSNVPGLLTQNDVTLAHLPFHHVYGMRVVLLPVHSGSGGTIIERRFDVEEFLDRIKRFRVTTISTIMPVMAFLTDFPEFLKKYDLSSLRYINNSAVSIVPEVARKLQELTGVTVTNSYGLSETSGAINANPPNRVKLESVGPPLPGTEEKIVDVETGTKELPQGEVGEVVVRGPQVMRGYWKNPEATREALRDGWLYTGDLGKMDEDGYLYIVGRKKEIIKFKGFVIAPAELEGVLMEHPGVADCAVVGKPSPVAGEVPKAFVALKGGARVTEDELIKFVEDKVALFKKIREVEFVESIPKSPAGKVLRGEFIERVRG